MSADDDRASGPGSSSGPALAREALVKAAARRGASTATRQRQLVEDAVAETVQRWQARVAGGSPIRDEVRWARQVAANLAKRLGEQRSRRAQDSDSFDLGTLTIAEHLGDGVGPTAGARRVLRAAIERRRKNLTPKQLVLLRKLSEKGMSLHLAAKELQIDRSNLRRMLARALHRLQGI